MDLLLPIIGLVIALGLGIMVSVGSSGARRFTSTKWPRWFVPNWVSNPSVVFPNGVAITPAFAMITSSGAPFASK